MLLCTAAGAVAAGVPLHWLPAPLVAACGMALFLDSGSLREYIVFVVGAFVTGAWVDGWWMRKQGEARVVSKGSWAGGEDGCSRLCGVYCS